MSVNWLREAIDRQRAGLSARLGRPHARIAEQCADSWDDAAALNSVLAENLGAISPCNLLYAVDPGGVQVSERLWLGT